MEAWRTKVFHVINVLSFDAWKRANHNKHGRRYKTHRQYALPDEATALVRCLDLNNEVEAKEIMMGLRNAGWKI